MYRFYAIKFQLNYFMHLALQKKNLKIKLLQNHAVLHAISHSAIVN